MPEKLLADWDRYQQILINIIQNAVKFTFSGDIKIFLNFQACDAIHATVMNSQQFHQCDSCGFLVTKVIDSGVGMSNQIKQKLFKIFANFSNNEKGEIGTSGIGLGLSISKELIKALKGNIEIESELGKGTEVIFKIGVSQNICKVSQNFKEAKSRNQDNTISYDISRDLSANMENEYKIQIIHDSPSEGRLTRQVTKKFQQHQHTPIINIKHPPLNLEIKKAEDEHFQTSNTNNNAIKDFKRQETIKKYLLNEPQMNKKGPSRRLFGGDVDVSSINITGTQMFNKSILD